MAKRIFSLAAVCLLGFMLLPAANESAQTVSVAVGSNSPAADDASAAGQLLFPELSDTDITGIRIHANDDCEFDFSVRGEHGRGRFFAPKAEAASVRLTA